MTTDRQRLAARLAEDYAPNLTVKIQDLLFRKAWEDGHASGESEVEQVYEELAFIANTAAEEAR